MNKSQKDSLILLSLAAIIGFLGSYSANYIFTYFQKLDECSKTFSSAYNVFGILSIILFSVLILLIPKIALSKLKF
jgi:hypothetical protein